MFRLIKRLISLVFVLIAIALILNLNIAGRPAREHALEIWHNESVQKVYQVVRDRFMALIRKDISVEDVFKADITKPAKVETPMAKATPAQEPTKAEPKVETKESKVIDLEHLSDDDRKALEKILENSKK